MEDHMRSYITENDNVSGLSVALDDMIMTNDMPTTAGSKMLDGYVSLFNAEVADRLASAGYAISGKANVGEFSIDLLGETSHFGACVGENERLLNASSEILKDGRVKAVVCLDVSGTPRRAAALFGNIFVKPTYGTVSRYGTVPVACSGETVGVMARTSDDCRDVLKVISGHDSKDGTSHSDEKCALINAEPDNGARYKIAIVKSLCNHATDETKAILENFKTVISNKNTEATEIEAKELASAKTAWNILMSAEMCNNVSRYDGIKYGHRSENYKNIDELYTNSRTEAFGDLTKTAILFGSDALSTENYEKVYDKALRIRRVIAESFASLFEEFDAVIMPACSKASYSLSDVKENAYIAFDEALYTAPSSITGLPTVVIGGVQIVGKAFSESVLFDIAKRYESEGK